MGDKKIRIRQERNLESNTNINFRNDRVGPVSNGRDMAYNQSFGGGHGHGTMLDYSVPAALITIPGLPPPQLRNQQQQLKPSTMKNEIVKKKESATILIVIQILLIVGFCLFTRYDEDANPNVKKSEVDQNGAPALEDRLKPLYPMFQDVHVMIFIGFGFLMTFLRKYGYSAVGYNLLIAAIAIQWSVLCRGLFHHGTGGIPISIETLINGDFAAAAVLITFGAVLGVTSPVQLVTLTLIEVFLYALNEYIGAELFKAIDVGGSMYIHTFGAYFGLALSLSLRRANDLNTEKEEASSTSDLFAMIGTVFLWMFWPSFNGALAVGDDQHRAVLNTVLSLTASCVFSFGLSGLLNHENKFNMVHIQNASLAGGVAVGATADLMLRPFGALLVGSTAGIISVLGYVYLTPLLQRTIGLHDTCGVHNLHGMPGVLAGLIGVLMAALASEGDYGKSLYLTYKARAPMENSSELSELRNNDLVGIEPGMNRTAGEQAVYQLGALGLTLAIAIIGGAITGLILRIPVFVKVPKDDLFDDSRHWEVPGEIAIEVQGGDKGIANQTFEPNMGNTKESEF